MIRYPLLVAIAGVIALGACEIDEQVDANAPSIASIEQGATPAQLNLLISGLEADIRSGLEGYVTATGSVARELYLFDADPRNITNLIAGTLDNNTFYITGPYGTAYGAVKSANLLLDALDNTESVTDAEKQGYRGVANTFKAFALQRVINMTGSNGIRVDVVDPDNLGPFLSEGDGLAAIRALYDEALGQLTAGEFLFTLSDGFADFDDPGTFSEFNRALAARTTLQQRDFAAVLPLLDSSFYELGVDPGRGPDHIFSTASGDILNPLYRIPDNTSNMIFAQPGWFTDAAAGDKRVAAQVETRLGENGTTIDTFVVRGLAGIYETRKYPTSTSPIKIIGNEELHLIAAEALAQTGDFEGAIENVNVVRTLAGIGEYEGEETLDALIDEILYQRRYSLWQTGLRFTDLRRYDRLNAEFLPIDRPNDVIPPQFPIPQSEGL